MLPRTPVVPGVGIAAFLVNAGARAGDADLLVHEGAGDKRAGEHEEEGPLHIMIIVPVRRTCRA